MLHDAEDLVPAGGLPAFRALVDRFDMVQLPVQALPDPASRWVGGHYIDEFAEAHVKELPTRAALGAVIPSAGVGCMVSARLLAAIAERDGLPFATDSLTEDYELGHRVKALGLRAAFVRVPDGLGVVATREFFPGSLDAALRQKTRWLMGIALHGWDRLRWDGSMIDRWMLWRDRKGLLTALLSLAAYAAALLLGAILALRALWPPAAALPDFVTPNSGLDTVLLFNVAAMLWRLAWRARSTWLSHGWREAARSIPRALTGNVVNGLAAARAVSRYAAVRSGRRALAWDKTHHRFPEAA